MPRPKVARVPRNVRLPTDVDEALTLKAAELDLSVNAAFEAAVRAWTEMVDLMVVTPGEVGNRRRAIAAANRPRTVRDLSFGLVRPGFPIDRQASPKKPKP